MPTLGYKPSGAAQGLATTGPTGSQNYIAYIPDSMSVNGWAYRISSRSGPRGSSETAVNRLAILSGTGGNPSDVIMESSSFSLTTRMDSGATGTVHTEDLSGFVRLFSGRTYALAQMATSPSGIGVGMIEVAAYGGHDNYYFWWDDDGSFPMADPMTPSGSSFEGHLAIWVDYETNVPPDKPTVLSPANGATPTTITPVFEANFADDNETLPNGILADKLSHFSIEVRRISDNHLMWGFDDDSTSDERSDRKFSRTYGGSTLSAGAAYRWRGVVYDQFGVASTVSDWATFTPGTGSVDKPSAPSGKIETRTPGPFVSVWRQTGGLSTNGVKVKIVNTDTGVTARESSSWIAKTVAPNGTISITWADTGFSQLSWGGNYTVQIQGRDTAGSASGYSPVRAFNINDIPQTPTNLSPDGGDAWSSRPTLTCKVTDDDTVATGLVVKCYTKEATSGTVHGPYSMTLRTGTTNIWDLVTTATHLPVLDSYTWWAYSGDGTIWSGGATVEASAALSYVANFVYAAGPVVTVTNPTPGQVLTTDTPHFTWTTSSTQGVYRVVVRDTATLDELVNTNNVVSAVQFYDMPSGLLHNGGSYEMRVWVTDTLALTGQSAWIPFSLIYTDPDPIDGFHIVPYFLDGDVDQPSGARLVWTPSTAPSGFRFYNITRVPDDSVPVSVEDSHRTSRKIRVARITSQATGEWIDDTAASFTEYVWHVRQFVQMGSDIVSSQLIFARAILAFEYGVLQMVPEGLGSLSPFRAVFAYRKDVQVEPQVQDDLWFPMGKMKPLKFKGNLFYRKISGTFILYAESVAATNEIIRQCEYLRETAKPLLWRDGRSRRMFCSIDDFSETDPAGGRLRSVDMTLGEIDFPELYES